MGSINSYHQYREYFGFPLEGGTPSTGIVYAIYTIGNLVGSFAARPATDSFRRFPRFVDGPSALLTACRSPYWNGNWITHHCYRNDCTGYLP